LKEIDDKVNFIVWIFRGQKEFKQDTKDFNSWDRFKEKELQARTLPTADRDQLPYTNEERTELIEYDYHDDEGMVEIALKLHRTYYGVEIENRRLYNVTIRS